MDKRLLRLNEKFLMKKELLKLARKVRSVVKPKLYKNQRSIIRRELGGDPHFLIDELAEKTVEYELRKWREPIAYFSEDRGLVKLSTHPQWLLSIDPIDGTRPAMANVESCCFSVAVTPYSENPTYKDITHALILELKTGAFFYAEATLPTIVTSVAPPSLVRNVAVDHMFWSTELTAHPIEHLTKVCGNLINSTVTAGAVFVFTSSTYSLTRIITGQLDAHVDVGHRIITEHPEYTKDFEKVGRGKVTTLFPYDIAAAAFIVSKAGGTVTDAYGHSLDPMPLITDKSVKGQCSIIATSTKELHEQIEARLCW